MYKTINLSENTKNKILTAEGILLLLCVLLPSATLLFKVRSHIIMIMIAICKTELLFSVRTQRRDVSHISCLSLVGTITISWLNQLLFISHSQKK